MHTWYFPAAADGMIRGSSRLLKAPELLHGHKSSLMAESLSNRTRHTTWNHASVQSVYRLCWVFLLGFHRSIRKAKTFHISTCFQLFKKKDVASFYKDVSKSQITHTVKNKTRDKSPKIKEHPVGKITSHFTCDCTSRCTFHHVLT